MLLLSLLSPDTTLCVLNHVDTVSHMGMLACTSQFFLRQIQANPYLWTNAGKRLCGAEHWPEKSDHMPLGSTQPTFVFDDPRYLTMTRICPWMAAPKRIELGFLHSIRALGGTYNFKTLDVINHMCRLTITLRGDGLLQGGPPTPLLIRTDAYGMTARFNAATQIGRAWKPKPPSLQEEALLEELQRTQWRPTALYESDITAVRVVHDGLFCVLASNSNILPTANTVLYFVSTRTRSVLHTHQFYMRPQWKMSNIFFRPGEIWIYEDYLNVPTLTYFGPNQVPSGTASRSPALPLTDHSFTGASAQYNQPRAQSTRCVLGHGQRRRRPLHPTPS